MSKYIVQGGIPLKGKVRISGSKNAALPIIAAMLLTDEECVLHDVPDIADVRIMIEIAQELGAEARFENNTLTICAKNIKSHEISKERAKQLRTSIMFLAPLLVRKKEVFIPFPGGCNIGKRPVDSHIRALSDLGAVVHQADEMLHLSAEKLLPIESRILSFSVTGTETALMAAASIVGKTILTLAACEPHVQDLCEVLIKMGAKISGIGTNTLVVEGTDHLKGMTHTITPDYIEAGTFVIASLMTQGTVEINNIVPAHLEILWDYLDEMGAQYELGTDFVKVLPSPNLLHVKRVRSGIYPDFPTDLLAPMAVLLTQCYGINRIFETIYEARLNYIIELEKMRVNCEILNAHEAIIVGPNKLIGAPVASWDLRAGTAMVLAGLGAEGETEVSNVVYIDRGYEGFEQKLTALGANIERILD